MRGLQDPVDRMEEVLSRRAVNARPVKDVDDCVLGYHGRVIAAPVEVERGTRDHVCRCG